jgi:beta-ureidopropionase / N-carbamoyl-L-amino-acid hydrolase
VPGCSSGFDRMWGELLPIGRDPDSGGYRRFAWTAADLECREWFAATAAGLGLDVETDRNQNLWAWWLPPGWTGEPRDAFVAGSHLDSVPDGGAFDGPLGVVGALAAVEGLQHSGFVPARPIAVVVFADEEGARFGVACIGSRLACGLLDPARALALADSDGTSLAAALRAAGVDPASLGQDPGILGRIGLFVEAHVEQGRALGPAGAPLGIGSAIWPHGRWRLTFDGEANHAGTTTLRDRRDPVLTFAATALAARSRAQEHHSLATFGRVQVSPGATNSVASRVEAWLDARAPDQATLDAVVTAIWAGAADRASLDGVTVGLDAESTTAVVDFPAAPREHFRRVLGDLPVLPTGAGHDAGILASAGVPAGMLFVRNPTGVSHAPSEHADPADCHAGADALAALMADWCVETSGSAGG